MSSTPKPVESSDPPKSASGGLPAARVALLRAIKVFRHLPEKDLLALGAHVEMRSYPARHELFRQGDRGDFLYLIVDGSVTVQRSLASGRKLHIASLHSGEHFGEAALLGNESRMADAVTETDCHLLTLHQRALIDLLVSHPHIVLCLSGGMALMLQSAAESLEVRSELDTTGRLAECLAELAETEGERMSDGFVRLRTARTHAELASYVGTARGCVTRALRDLQKLGAIRAEGKPTRITIVSERKLAQRCRR